MTIYEKLTEQIENTRFAEDNAKSPYCKKLWRDNHDKLIKQRQGLTVQEASVNYHKLSGLAKALHISTLETLEVLLEAGN